MPFPLWAWECSKARERGLFSADAYTYLWSQRQTILHALWVSVYVTVIGTVIGVALTTVMGYVLSRTEHKLNNFLTILIFIPMVFGGGMAASFVVTSHISFRAFS